MGVRRNGFGTERPGYGDWNCFVVLVSHWRIVLDVKGIS